MAVLSLLRSALLVLPLALPALAARSHRDLAAHSLDAGDAGKKRCGKTNVKIEFPSITLDFFIPVRTSLDKTYTVPCGPTAGNPEETVLFKCTELHDGIFSYQMLAGICKSKELVEEEKTPKCVSREMLASWTVGDEKIDLNFTLPLTVNPTGKDLPVAWQCPENSPGAGKPIEFICKGDGSWDLNSMDATQPCLSAGDDKPQQEEKPVVGGLPCKFESQEVGLTTGDKGFQLLITCTEAVTDAKVEAFVHGMDLQITAADIQPNVRTVITTQKLEDFKGRTFVFVARSNGVLGSLSASLAGTGGETSGEEPEAATPLAEGSLPCTLSKKDVTLTTNEPGFTIQLDCTDTVHNAALKMPGYADKRFSGGVGPGLYSLTTQEAADFKGKTFVLTGEYEGKEGSTNSVDI
uniref:Uncharacterized protein n=1 Tax=Alexandrium andersonii TaxID=327968 RepID=A0A7S2F8F8_9DINO